MSDAAASVAGLFAVVSHDRPSAKRGIIPGEKRSADARVPRSLFDSVTDNLIRNALAKRVAEPRLRVRVSLDAGALRVSDTGTAVPGELEAGLLRAPVPSSAGLGIGLYQAARQAEAAGYRLELEKNRDGEVCFALRAAPHAQGSTPAAMSLP